jgi:Flp pilus assembly protein TadB
MTWLKFGQRSRIRQQTLQLVSLLSRWCQVREDLLFAFDKSLAAGLENPMRQAVADFLSRVRGGMAMEQALDLFQKSLNHEHFQDLITSIRFNFRHRGNLPALLELLEVQLHKIEEEYDRRRLSNARDFNLTLAILLIVPAIFLVRLTVNPMISQLFLVEPVGLALLVFGSMAYSAAVAGTWMIQRHISG